MSITALAGFALAVGAVLGGLLLDGGSIRSLIIPSALILVFGGTIGATLVGLTMDEIRRVPKLLMSVVRPEKVDLLAVREIMVRLADVARREGLLRLEDELENGDQSPIVTRGVGLVVDGSDEERIRQVLEDDLAIYEEDQAAKTAIFETAGGYAPTLGIIGTVMGLVSVLSNLSDIQKLAPSIATAFTATLWGVASANLFWLPVATNLKGQARRQVRMRLMVIEGCVAISRGLNPRLVEEALSVYIDSDSRRPAKDEEKGEETEEGPQMDREAS